MTDPDPPPDPAGRPPPSRSNESSPITSSAKIVAYKLIADETRVAQRPLCGLVDAVACVLTHGRRSDREETARLALETIAPPPIALAAVRALIDNGRQLG